MDVDIDKILASVMLEILNISTLKSFIGHSLDCTRQVFLILIYWFFSRIVWETYVIVERAWNLELDNYRPTFGSVAY